MAKLPSTPPAPSRGTNYPQLRSTRAAQAAEQYAKARIEADKLKQRLDALRDDLLRAMGDAPIAYAGSRVVRRIVVAPIAPVTIVPEMVGRELPGRAGYVRIDVR